MIDFKEGPRGARWSGESNSYASPTDYRAAIDEFVCTPYWPLGQTVAAFRVQGCSPYGDVVVRWFDGRAAARSWAVGLVEAGDGAGEAGWWRYVKGENRG